MSEPLTYGWRSVRWIAKRHQARRLGLLGTSQTSIDAGSISVMEGKAKMSGADSDFAA
jgi:hypothetical protein